MFSRKRLLVSALILLSSILFITGCGNFFKEDPIVIIDVVGGGFSGTSPFEVTFRADVKKKSDDIVLYKWSFGDGSPIANGQEVKHTFLNENSDTPISFMVSLTATDACGRSGSNTQSIEIKKPLDPPHVLSISYWSSGECCMYYTFSANVDQAVDEWEWDLGDGTIMRTLNFTHRYLFSGFVDVKLRVRAENKLWSDTYVERVYIGCCDSCCDLCPGRDPSPCSDCLNIGPSYSEFLAYSWKTITASFNDCSSCVGYCNSCYGTCDLSPLSCGGIGYILLGQVLHCNSSASSDDFEVQFSGVGNMTIKLNFHKTGKWKVEFVRYGCNGHRICSVWGEYGIYLP